MPPPIQSTLTPTRLDILVKCLTLSVSTLTELCDAFSAPFLKAISNTTAALVVFIQNIKRNQDQCLHLAEQVQVVLCAIARLHMESEHGAGVGTLMLDHIGRFTETLHKIYVFTEAQHDTGIIKRIFRFNDHLALLNDCNAGMEQATISFKSNISINIVDMQRNIEQTHEELLELLSSFSDNAPSDYLPLINQPHSTEQSSSVSFSLLPPEPKIFHGRESEVQHILGLFSQATPRVIILGPGGIGKTSLARAVLHHPTIATQYTRRVFIPCDSAPSHMELAALLALNLGLDPAPNLTRPIVQFFRNSPSTLLVLDNFETSWEPDDSRVEVEKLLSLLAGVPHLGLLVTMRGAERPNMVHWTRPFMAPLEPLTHEAAFQTFIDIADDVHELGDVQKLLALTDYLPLAVDIMAHLVDYEDCNVLLSKWEQQRTAMIAVGTDRKSSLDVSIELSFSSPRLVALPDAKHLLSLLSILPDGLSDSELQQSNISIPDILTCKAALLRTSLGYMTSDYPPRLKLLAPIREYLALAYPPLQSHVQSLRESFHPLLKLSIKDFGLVSGISTLRGLTSNRGNLRNLILLGLGPNSTDRKFSVESAIALNMFMRLTGQGCSDLMMKIPTVLSELQDSYLEAQYITQVLTSWLVSPQLSSDPESLIVRGKETFGGVQDVILESDFHCAIGEYYRVHLNDTAQARKYFESGIELGVASGSIKAQCNSLVRMAWLLWQLGEYSKCQQHSQKAQHISELAGALYPQIRALHIEANVCISMGNYKQSSTLVEKARLLLKLCGITEGTVHLTLMNTEAELHLIKTEYDLARSIQLKIVDKTSLEKSPFNLAFAYANLAFIDIMTGAQRHQVLNHVEKARSLFTVLKILAGLAYCDLLEADLELCDGSSLIARPVFIQILGTYRGNNKDITTYCLERLADPIHWGRSAWTTVFVAHAAQSSNNLQMCEALRRLGDMFILEGDLDTAQSLFQVALDGFTQMDIFRGRGECLQRLGDMRRLKQDLQGAVELWKQARALFQQSLQVKSMRQIDERLETVNEDHQLDELDPKVDIILQ